MIYLVAALVLVNIGLTYLAWEAVRWKGGSIADADVRKIDDASARLEGMATDGTPPKSR